MTTDAQTERLISWYNGTLSDDDLTTADIEELQKRVFDAISKKVLAREGVHTFAQHKTMQ